MRRIAASKLGGRASYPYDYIDTDYYVRATKMKGLTAFEKASIRNVVCNAVWTRSRLFKAGKVVDNKCTQCKLGASSRRE